MDNGAALFGYIVPSIPPAAAHIDCAVVSF